MASTVTMQSGNVIPAQYASYIPGKSVPFNSIPSLRGCRKLTFDEYQFYYIQLDSTSLSDAVKCAIATVLDNDNKNLYANYINQYSDPVLAKWISLKNSFTADQVNVMNGEMASFAGFLQYTVAADFYPPNVLPYLISAEAFNNASLQQASQNIAAQKLQDQADAAKAQEQQAKIYTSLKAAADAFDLTMTDDQEKFINAHVEDYLHAIETDEYSNMALDGFKRNAKDQSYQEILGQYKSGKIDYTTAMKMYREALTKIDTLTLDQETLLQPGSILSPKTSYAHPMQGLVSK